MVVQPSPAPSILERVQRVSVAAFFALAATYMVFGPCMAQLQGVGRPYFPEWAMFSRRGHGVFDVRVYREVGGDLQRVWFNGGHALKGRTVAPQSYAQMQARVRAVCREPGLAGANIVVEAREGTREGWRPHLVHEKRRCPN